MIERRGGDGSVTINSDLTLASLSVDPLAWAKPSGNVANASARLLLSHDRLTKIDRISVQGEGLLLNGSADFPDGHIRTLLLDSIRLGRTQGHGTVHFGTNEPLAIVLQGEQVDLAPKLSEKMSGPDKSTTEKVTTPAWALDARFDHAILANGERASDMLVKAAGGGTLIPRARCGRRVECQSRPALGRFLDQDRAARGQAACACRGKGRRKLPTRNGCGPEACGPAI